MTLVLIVLLLLATWMAEQLRPATLPATHSISTNYDAEVKPVPGCTRGS